jgi:hypothetical protein
VALWLSAAATHARWITPSLVPVERGIVMRILVPLS